MKTAKTVDLSDVVEGEGMGRFFVLLFLVVTDLVNFVVLKLEKPQEILRYGLEITLRGIEQIVSHRVIS
jgi:hypothetical protein